METVFHIKQEINEKLNFSVGDQKEEGKKSFFQSWIPMELKKLCLI
jgi:hypothetical protein